MFGFKVAVFLALAASSAIAASNAPCPYAHGSSQAGNGNDTRMTKAHRGGHRGHRHHHHHASSGSEAGPRSGAGKSSSHRAEGGSKKTKSEGNKNNAKTASHSGAGSGSSSKSSSSSGSSGTSKGSSGGSGATNGLDVHNAFRAKYGAADLVWDSKIASGAQDYAETCATGHSGVSGLGENLSWGTKDINSGVQLWLNEAKDYDYSNPGFSMTTGHFTQVVWKSTTKVGCGFSKCGGQFGTMTVCRYSPPGNYVNAGQFEKNVGRPV